MIVTNPDYQMGLRYLTGDGVPRDFTNARKYFQLAADRGVREAYTKLGRLVADGKGGPRDDARAVALYRRGAEQGDPVAQSYLGLMYSLGRGVSQDVIEGAKWAIIARACLADMESSAAETLAPIDDLVGKLRGELSGERLAEAERRAQEWLATKDAERGR